MTMGIVFVRLCTMGSVHVGGGNSHD